VDVNFKNDKVRVVQLTPPGSSCSIALLEGFPKIAMQPGIIRGLHLVVGNIYEARNELIKRGIEMGEVEVMDRGVKYAGFSDPDGNTWTLQEMPWRSSDFTLKK